MARRGRPPRVNSEGQIELDKAQEKFDKFQEQVASLDAFEKRDAAPNTEQQTKLSKKEISNLDAPFIKPVRSINSKEKFNPTYRKDWERGWEYVKVIVENNEIIGEAIEVWTKAFAGDPAHFWKVPVNKPIYIPRLLAQQLSKCQYHRLRTENRMTGPEQGGIQEYGALVVDEVKHRIDARPVGNTF